MFSTTPAKFSNFRKLEPNDTYLKSHFLVYFSQFSIYSLAYQIQDVFFVDHNIYLRGGDFRALLTILFKDQLKIQKMGKINNF